MLFDRKRTEKSYIPMYYSKIDFFCEYGTYRDDSVNDETGFCIFMGVVLVFVWSLYRTNSHRMSVATSHHVSKTLSVFFFQTLS